jgi:YfiH family protein
MDVDHFEVIVPDWPAPDCVRACCSTRNGGTSEGQYANLNLGLHVGDDPARVHTNRVRWQAHIGVRAVFMNQVHGSNILQLDPQIADGEVADGAFTNHTHLACAVMVADCLPILLCDTQGRQVAAVHAGWRGLLGAQGRGVLDSAVVVFESENGATGAADRSNLLAWLGPCIGPRAFEVGDEVRAAFVADAPGAEACFKPANSQGKWWADLPALARQRLAGLGVTHVFGNDGSDAWCTVTHASKFFSHRRDGVSGRMVASIWRVA